MDVEEKERFLGVVRRDVEFREVVRREILIQDFLALPQAVAHLAALVGVFSMQQAEMQRELTAIRGALNTLVDMTRECVGVTQRWLTEMREGRASEDESRHLESPDEG